MTQVETETAAPYILWMKSQGLVDIDGDKVRLREAGRKRMDAYLDRQGHCGRVAGCIERRMTIENGGPSPGFSYLNRSNSPELPL
ncbi:hypothetical protein P0F65_13620 [Sphingomonas sp. I4]